MLIRILVPLLIAVVTLAVSCAGEAITPSEEVLDSRQSAVTPTPVASPTVASAPVTTPMQGGDLDTVRERVAARRPVDRGSGAEAEGFDLDLFDGGSLSLSDLQGKVVVLNFWASWCGPCRAEMPDLQHISEEYADKGVVFLGIALGDTEKDARKFADTVGVTYPLGLDATGDIAVAYRVLVLPTTVLIDRKGAERRKIATAVNEGALRFFLDGLVGAR